MFLDKPIEFQGHRSMVKVTRRYFRIFYCCEIRKTSNCCT